MGRIRDLKREGLSVRGVAAALGLTREEVIAGLDPAPAVYDLDFSAEAAVLIDPNQPAQVVVVGGLATLRGRLILAGSENTLSAPLPLAARPYGNFPLPCLVSRFADSKAYLGRVGLADSQDDDPSVNITQADFVDFEESDNVHLSGTWPVAGPWRTDWE